MSQTGNIIQQAPPWAKGVLIVAGTATAVFVGYKIYKKIESLKQTRDERLDERAFEKTGITLTYPVSNYVQFADSLYAARSGNKVLGTDEDAIYAVIEKMKNDLDVLNLIQAFGSRRKSFSWEDANLGGFLADELNEKEIEKVNSMLASKNIKYRF